MSPAPAPGEEGLEELEALDRRDPLAGLRDAFELPEGVVYLDGNSLGPLPRRTRERVDRTLRREWGGSLIRSWNEHGWIDLADRVAERLAALLGAAPGQVAVADSTSTNLFKLLGGALRLAPGRPVILSEAENFPSDLYVASGVAEWLGRGHRLEVVPRAELADALDERVAVLMLTQVDFRSGALHSIPDWTRRAHEVGALTLWDLAHSAGVLPLELDRDGVDLAVGCGYKYLNGGPGAPSFAYVASRHLEAFLSPLQGWLGHRDPFAFELGWDPAPGVGRLQCGTPPILSLVALAEGVEMLAEVGNGPLREKSRRLGEVFLAGVEARCAGLGLELASPRDPGARGAQLAFRHPEAYALTQALIDRGVIGDFRAPDLLRFGFSPAFLRYVDLDEAARRLEAVLREEAFRSPAYRRRQRVT